MGAFISKGIDFLAVTMGAELAISPPNRCKMLNSSLFIWNGLGKIEKDDDRRTRLLREKSEELALELWKQAGCPEAGLSQFLVAARQKLEKALKPEQPE